MYNPAFQGHGQRRIAGLLGSASIRALIFGGAFVVGMDSAQADPLTWDAGNPNGDVTIEPGNGNWNSDAANLVWFNPVAAGADAFQTGDDVFFTDPLSGGPFTVTMTQGVRIGSMTFDAAGYTIVPSNPGLRIFSNGASSGIITNGNATIESALRGTFDLSGTATLTLNSSSSLDYRLNIMSGTVVNTGDLTNTGGVGSARVVNFGGTFTNTGTIENYGQVLGFGNFEGTANGNITLNGGSFDLTNTLAVSGAFVNNLTTPIVVDNDLTVNSFQNSGMTQVDMGSTLTIAGAGQVFNNKTGATLDINAGGTVDGSIVHTGLALIVGGSVTGDVDANADMTLESTGDIDGELAVGAGATAAAEGGTVDTVVVENGAIFDLTTPGSTVTVDGTGAGAEFDLQAGGTLTTTSGGAVMLDVTEDFASAGAINGGAGASQLTIQAATIDLNTGTTFAGNEVILLGNIENAVTLTFGTGYTLAGTLLNETGGTVNFNAAMNAGGFDITNTGTATLNVNPTGSITNAGTIALQNASTMAIDAGASVQATVINNTGSGLLTVDGTATTDVNNTGTGTVDVNATGAITGTLTNNARATLAGNVGAIDNQGSGDLDFDGTMTVAGNVANAGMVDVNGGVIVTVNGATGTTNTGTGLLTVNGTLISDVVNRNMATVTVNDTLTGNLTNDDMGRVNLAGTVNGNVTNVTIDNTLNVTGPSTITGDFDTAGQTKVMADLTVTGAATNRADAVLDVDAGRTLTNAAVQNAGDVILGGTIAGSLFNVTADSKLTVDGAAAITGNLNTLGDVDISAANSLAVAGDILSEAEFTANGNLSWGPLSTFTNTAAGTLALNGVMATGRTLNNAGRLTFGNGTLVNAAINSTGTMDVTGNVILNGAVTQSGLVDLQQMAGMTNDVLNVTGPANFNGSVFRLDSELAGGGSSSDQIIVSGALTGDFQLAFNAIGSPIAGQSTTILQFAGATSVFSSPRPGSKPLARLCISLHGIMLRVRSFWNPVRTRRLAVWLGLFLSPSHSSGRWSTARPAHLLLVWRYRATILAAQVPGVV